MSDEQKESASDWRNSCVDQSLVSTAWKRAESAACNLLKEKLPIDDMDHVEQQAVLRVLGQELVAKYFPKYSNVLKEGSRDKKNAKKTREMTQLITDILEPSSEDKGSRGKRKKSIPELNSFYHSTKEIVDATYQLQTKQKKSKKNRSAAFSNEEATLMLLRDDSSMVRHISSKFQAAAVSLPDYLRVPIWTECLFVKEKLKDQGQDNLNRSKKKFLQLSRKQTSFESSIGSLEDVRKVCEHVAFTKQRFPREGVQFVSDVVSLYDRFSNNKASRQCVFWAIPMWQLKFTLNDEQDSYDDDHAVVTAVYLEKVLRLCTPTVDQLFDIASRVSGTIEKQDKEFMDHLKQSAAVDIPHTIRDFPPDVISLDKKRVKLIYQNLTEENTPLPEDVKALIGHSDIFLRKWIYEGFVSVLGQNVLFLVWDQLFLNGWSSQVLQKVCLAIMGLLRPWFMVSRNYLDVREVFLNEPSRLYTLDVVKAFRHLKSNGKFTDLARMNRNVFQGSMPPAPPSPQPAPRVPSPPPKPVPITKSFVPWVPYEKERSRSQMPLKTKVDHPFDIYVDSVRLLPDNATVVKITGKVLNVLLQRKDKFHKIVGFPNLDSPSRYPQFTVKQTVNKEAQPVNPDVVVMLRVYTIERHSKKQTVLGSCLFCPFSNKRGKQATLRVGGHQLRLRHGIPDPDFTVEHMLASHMDNNPIIPGVTILVRVLPYEKNYISAPEYESCVYRSEFARPNGSENRVYKHYQDSKDFHSTVRDVAIQLFGTAQSTDDGLTKLISQHLDKEGSEVEDFPYQRFINYDQKAGMTVLADKAAGLPIFLDGRFLECLVQCFPGDETRSSNGRSQVKSFMTEELDLESTLRAPDWTDNPTKLNPEYDDRAYLLISLYGLRPQYNPSAEKLVDKGGKELRFDLQHAIAWSVVPCFDKQAVFAGSHHVPLLKGRPSDDILEKLGYLPFDFICKKLKNSLKIFDSASIEISIWDGHFTYDECPPLPTHLEYLSISSNPKKYLAAKKQNYGETVLQLLKSGMLGSSSFSDHQVEFLELLKKAFKENMNRALENSGYSSLLN